MITKKIHNKFIYNRRMETLSNCLGELLEPKSKVLDVGCGDGKIDQLILDKFPNNEVRIYGIDILVRDHTFIDVTKFDGNKIPFPDNSFDTAIIIDVLHHTDNPEKLIAEICRVCKKSIIIKDHNNNGFLSNFTLKLMDYVGNKHYNVVLPYNYLTKNQWKDIFQRNNLEINTIKEKLGLYAFPLNLFFERQLHFIARVDILK